MSTTLRAPVPQDSQARTCPATQLNSKSPIAPRILQPELHPRTFLYNYFLGWLHLDRWSRDTKTLSIFAHPNIMVDHELERIDTLNRRILLRPFYLERLISVLCGLMKCPTLHSSFHMLTDVNCNPPLEVAISLVSTGRSVGWIV